VQDAPAAREAPQLLDSENVPICGDEFAGGAIVGETAVKEGFETVSDCVAEVEPSKTELKAS
jgi:hypothetical protein